MFATQKQVIDSLVRIRAFIEAHPARGRLTYRGALEMFDDAFEEIRRCASTQLSGRMLGRASQRRQVDLVAQLRDVHMRPIVTIARAHLEFTADAGLSAAFRLPRGSMSLATMLQHCDGMIAMARRFESLFVAQGLPDDFLAEFVRAREALVALCEQRMAYTTSHVAARAGLVTQLRRARLAVNRLDAVVRVAFRGDATVLETWRRVKRVHALASGPRESGSAPHEEDGAAPILAMAQAAA